MLRVSVFVASSLDGYIATEQDSLDWLEAAACATEEYGFESFLADVDLVAMGRATYEFIRETPDLPYGDRPIHVFTNRTDTLRAGFTAIAMPPREAVQLWVDMGVKHACIDGGVLVSSFLHYGLVDDLILTVAPVLLGSGKPLFHASSVGTNLHLVSAQPFPSGMVQLHYKRA